MKIHGTLLPQQQLTLGSITGYNFKLRRVPNHTSLDSNTPIIGFCSKKSLVPLSVRTLTNRFFYKDELSNKMGEGLFKPHGLYFSANVTDTTQISQSEVNQMEPRESTTGSGN